MKARSLTANTVVSLFLHFLYVVLQIYALSSPCESCDRFGHIKNSRLNSPTLYMLAALKPAGKVRIFPSALRDRVAFHDILYRADDITFERLNCEYIFEPLLKMP
eukprot:IDg11580t1